MEDKKGLFRDLKADEIDVRVQSVSDTGFSMLLYKDARCDMNILDETVGPYNWKREHLRDNMNCIVSIYDKENKQWVGKEDTGTESNTEKEKGLASDSFKRACFNWGIGRELYTSPFIWCSDTSYIKINKKTNKEEDTYTYIRSLKSIIIGLKYDIEKQQKDLELLQQLAEKNNKPNYPRNADNKENYAVSKLGCLLGDSPGSFTEEETDSE